MEWTLYRRTMYFGRIVDGDNAERHCNSLSESRLWNFFIPQNQSISKGLCGFGLLYLRLKFGDPWTCFCYFMGQLCSFLKMLLLSPIIVVNQLILFGQISSSNRHFAEVIGSSCYIWEFWGFFAFCCDVMFINPLFLSMDQFCSRTRIARFFLFKNHRALLANFKKATPLVLRFGLLGILTILSPHYLFSHFLLFRFRLGFKFKFRFEFNLGNAILVWPILIASHL